MKEQFAKAYGFILEKAHLRLRKKPEDTGPRYADMNDRALAAAIDVLWLYLIMFPMFLWIQHQLFNHIDLSVLSELPDTHNMTFSEFTESFRRSWPILLRAHYPQLWLLNALIQVGVIGVIIVSMQYYFGYTPGKKLFGLKVVDAGTLETPSLVQYIIRFFGYIPATLSLLVGIFWISFNKRRRGWHDYLAHTVVIHTRPRGWYWQQVKNGFRWLKGRLMR